LKRIIQAGIAAGFVVLAVLALFYGRAGKEAENRIDLAPRPSAAPPFREEATLRNVTKRPIAYTIMPGRGVRGPVTRTMAVGAVDRIATDLPVFERDLRPGARIVSHDYGIPGWDARLVRSETLTDKSGREHKIHLYRMPGKT